MAPVAHALVREGDDDRPALLPETLVVEHEFGVVHGLELFGALGLCTFKLRRDGGDALVHLAAELVDRPLFGVELRLGVRDAGFRGRKIVHGRKLVVLCGFEVVADKIDLNRVLLVFFVALETRLGGFELLDLLFEGFRLGLVVLHAAFGILAIGLGRRKIGAHAGKARRFKGFAARQILQLHLELANPSVNFLQLYERLYYRHVLDPFWGRRRDSNPQPTESQSVDLTN